MAGALASDWDPYCSYRSWNRNIFLLHILSKYFPFWLNPRRDHWERQIQFLLVFILYTLSISWLVWVINTGFLNLTLVEIIFIIFAIILKGISFLYIGYIFILRLKQLFGDIDCDDLLIQIQKEKCLISWIKVFMNPSLEIKISKKISKFLIFIIFYEMIVLIIWYYSFGSNINNTDIIPKLSFTNSTGDIIFKILWAIIIFIVIGITMIIPYVIISCILYLRIEDMRYLISNQQYFNKILDLHSIICSKNMENEENIDQIISDEDESQNNNLQEIVYKSQSSLEFVGGSQVKIPTLNYDCRGLIKFYEQIYTHFIKFFNIFKYWFLFSGASVIIFIWCMISQIYSSCIDIIPSTQCFGVISFTLIYFIYLLCLIIIILSAMKITDNFNELENCIEYTLNKCIIDSLNKKYDINDEWSKEMIVLQRLSVLTIKKPLHFQIFGVKISRSRLIWFVFIVITAKTIQLLYQFLK